MALETGIEPPLLITLFYSIGRFHGEWGILSKIVKFCDRVNATIFVRLMTDQMSQPCQTNVKE